MPVEVIPQLSTFERMFGEKLSNLWITRPAFADQADLGTASSDRRAGRMMQS
jgi:hypothetical protein